MGPKGCPETSITHYQSTVRKIPVERRARYLSRYSGSLRAGRVRGWNLGRRGDFPHTSRPALGPKQPPVQGIPRLFPGEQAAGAPKSSAEAKEIEELYI